MNIRFAFLVFLKLLVLIESKKRKNFCDLRLCPVNAKHTACKNSGAFGGSCPENIKLVKLTDAEKFVITDYHNYYRAKISFGDLDTFPGSNEKFPPARRMMLLRYNEEQAIIAGLHLKTCKSHDACRNTFFNETLNRFEYAGQNIASFFTYGQRDSRESYFRQAALNWFNEYQGTPLEIIDRLTFNTTYVVGHFTQMMYDKNNCLGCAMAEWTEDNGMMKGTKITCNYCKSHIGFQPVYIKSNVSCIDCTICDDTDYPTICLD